MDGPIEPNFPMYGTGESSQQLVMSSLFISVICQEWLQNVAHVRLRYSNPARGWRWEEAVTEWPVGVRSKAVPRFLSRIWNDYEEAGDRWKRTRMTMQYLREDTGEHVEFLFED